MATCYRHPNRETGVSCSNCGNPICPDCMTATPVGMRCPDCSRQRTQTRSLQSLAVDPIATYVLIALNVLIFFGVASSPGAENDLVAVRLRASTQFGGPLHGVAEGEYWRLISTGFLHVELWHIGLNMLALYWLGRMIEPALGHARFVAIYFTSLLTGSLARADPAARRRDAGRLRRGLRPAGRGDRDGPQPRHRPRSSRACCRSSA